jgi:hypothetical protein
MRCDLQNTPCSLEKEYSVSSVSNHNLGTTLGQPPAIHQRFLVPGTPAKCCKIDLSFSVETTDVIRI